MSRGRKPFVVVSLCGAYHCAGDCGLPHNQQEQVKQFTEAGRRQERKRLTLAAFDALRADERQTVLDAKREVRRKAKDAL